MPLTRKINFKQLPKMNSLSYLAIFIFSAFGCCAQLQNNHWAFGFNARVDFSSTPPNGVIPSAIFSAEQCATVSNPSTGELLFYTDGEAVWNINNQPMPNGFNLLGGAFLSCSQGPVIVPFPEDPNKYYIFTMDDLEYDVPQLDNGLRYTVVDMTLNNGLGDVDSLQKNIFLTDFLTEKMTVVRSEAIRGYWVIVHKKESNQYKIELIDTLDDGTITFCDHSDFSDLCKGGHIPSTGIVKAVKLLNIAGAYWRGDEKNNQLTRIYGISFPKQKLLTEYLELIEKAKERDHRKLGKELELFTFSSKVGQGLPLWLPKGTDLRDRLQSFLEDAQKKAGYKKVMSPHIGSKELYITSGHYEKYGEDSFQPIKTPNENEIFMLRPMNCPHHCEIFNSKPLSYRDLPLRLAEFGTVYRYEQSGELHGLSRVRGFTVDDAHIFCAPEQVDSEFKNTIDLVLYVFKSLGFSDFYAQVSLRDPDNTEKYIGSKENWNIAEQAILNAAKEKELNFKVEYGEAAFYGPKLDFMVKDALGRSWQLGTIQVDYNLPERFELTYKGNNNEDLRPVMLHRAPFGSMERFVAILLEHTGGVFPLWLSTIQVEILIVSENFKNYGQKVLNILENHEIRAHLDDRNETVGKKIRESEINKIPFMIVVGENEVKNNSISIRRHHGEDLGEMKIEKFVDIIKKEISDCIPEFNIN